MRAYILVPIEVLSKTEAKAREVSLNILNRIASRKTWIKRRQNEIHQLQDLATRLEKAYKRNDYDTIAKIGFEVNRFSCSKQATEEFFNNQ